MENELNTTPSMADFETEINNSFRQFNEGDIVSGSVISVSESEITLDLQAHAEGIITPDNFSREPGFSPKDSIQVGDEISASVLKSDDGQGRILLSKIAADDILAWDKLQAMMDEDAILDVVVKGIVKGGAVAYVEGVRGFIPASRLSLGYVEDTNVFLNQHLQVKIIEIDRSKKRLILSAREILRKKAAEERRNRISNVEIGLVTEGTVESLQPYGAFINLGNGLSGLVHVSQISEKRIKAPADVLSLGDRVKVKVTAIKDGKLSLSMKALLDTPPTEIAEEPVRLPEAGAATTNLGSLFANLKLD